MATTIYFVKTLSVTFEDDEIVDPETIMQDAQLYIDGMSYKQAGEELEDLLTITMIGDHDQEALEMAISSKIRGRYYQRKEPAPGTKIDDDGILHCNEFDLHDWIVGVLHTHNIDGNPTNEDAMGDYFSQIALELTGEEPYRMSEEHRKQLEDAANKVIGHVTNFDSFLHDVAEYTC